MNATVDLTMATLFTQFIFRNNEMQNSLSSPYSNLYDWQKKILHGYKPGDMTVLYSGRSTGKSMLSQYILNTRYGKRAAEMAKVVTEFTVAKAYKGEWKIELPWYSQANSIKEFEAWCQEMMGAPGRHGRYRWRKAQLHYGTYFVRNEQDLLMLTLRWSGV